MGVPQGHGEIVADVQPDGPAAKAGFKRGDVVMTVNGKDVTNDQSLSYLVANIAPGTRVPFGIIRNGKRMTLTATMATRPSEKELAKLNGQGGDNALPEENDQTTQEATSNSLGISVTPLTPSIARNIGVDAIARRCGDLGRSVERRRPEAQAQVIASVNGAAVTSAADVAAQIDAAKRAGRDHVLLYVVTPQGPNGFVAVSSRNRSKRPDAIDQGRPVPDRAAFSLAGEDGAPTRCTSNHLSSGLVAVFLQILHKRCATGTDRGFVAGGGTHLIEDVGGGEA